jgi:hypothetical protein
MVAVARGGGPHLPVMGRHGVVVGCKSFVVRSSSARAFLEEAAGALRDGHMVSYRRLMQLALESEVYWCRLEVEEGVW